MTALVFLYVSILINIFAVLVLIWLVTRYQELLDSYHSLREYKDRSQKVAGQWLEEARKKSEAIVEEAEGKAEQILQETILFDEGLKDKVAKKVEVMMDQIATLIASEVGSRVREAAKTLVSEAEEDFASAKKSIEEYKKVETDRIDKRVKAVIDDVAREILGRTLSKTDAEDLVRAALEKMPETHE